MIFYGVATPNLLKKLETLSQRNIAFGPTRELSERRTAPAATLSPTELMVCETMGVSVEQFVAARQARREKFLGASRPVDDADEVRSKVYFLMGLNPDGTAKR